MPPPLDQLDDEQIVRLVQQAEGEGRDARDLLAALLTRHQDRLYAVCLRMAGSSDAAADLLQDALVRIIRGIGSFDGRASFGTWSTRIAMNGCLSWLRRQRHRRHPSLDALHTPHNQHLAHPAGEPTPELASGSGVQDDGEHPVGQAALLRALDRLSDEHRAILILRDVRGLEYEQVGRVLDLPLGTVRSRLFRARAALRKALDPTPTPTPTPPPPQPHPRRNPTPAATPTHPTRPRDDA